LAVRVRLTRVGSKKNPIWRVVVADGRSPRDGRSIETIGHYNPQTQPSRIVIDRERLQHWLDRGAQPSNTVRKLMRAENTGFEIPKSAAPAPAPKRAAPVEADAAADAEAPGEPDTAEAPTAEAGADAGAPAAQPDASADAEAPAEEPEAVADAPTEPAAEEAPEAEAAADAPAEGDAGESA
jgi:small subunit ribosomal protein S16